MIMSWITDNEIVREESNIMNLKKALMDQFKYKCTIEKLELGGIKFRQKVLLQSYRDEFDIESLK